jgi:hypothetical protein
MPLGACWHCSIEDCWTYDGLLEDLLYPFEWCTRPALAYGKAVGRLPQRSDPREPRR